MNARLKCKLYKCKIYMEGNEGNLWYWERGQHFLDLTPKLQSMKEKLNKLELIKTNNFSPAKDQ